MEFHFEIKRLHSPPSSLAIIVPSLWIENLIWELIPRTHRIPSRLPKRYTEYFLKHNLEAKDLMNLVCPKEIETYICNESFCGRRIEEKKSRNKDQNK